MKTMPFTKPRTLALLAISCACAVSAQKVPDTTLVAGISPISQAANAWSAKNQILGRSVYNEQGQKMGKVDDMIVAPHTSGVRLDQDDFARTGSFQSGRMKWQV